MAVLLDDAFTRADSTTSPGSPTTGGPYTAQNASTWGISSGKLYSPTLGTSGTSALTFPAAANLTISANINAGSNTATGLIYRYVDNSNYWFWCTNNSSTTAALWRKIGGSFTQVTYNVPFVDGQTLQVSAFGNYHHFYVNGRLVTSLEDASQATATIAGVWTNGTTGRIDNLNAQDLATHPSSLNGSSNIQVYKGRDLNTDDTGSAA